MSSDTRKDEEGCWTVLVAAQVHAPSMQAAQQLLMDKMLVRPNSDAFPELECWWIAEDERYDGSDNDSAVMVYMGKQDEWAEKFAKYRDFPPCTVCEMDIMDTEMCPNCKTECLHCCGCGDHDLVPWQHRVDRVLELYARHDRGVEDHVTLIKDLMTDLVLEVGTMELDEQDVWEAAVRMAQAEKDEFGENTGNSRRIQVKADRENHEWRWATWTDCPTEPGGADDDLIDIRDTGMTVWSVVLVDEYLASERES